MKKINIISRSAKQNLVIDHYKDGNLITRRTWIFKGGRQKRHDIYTPDPPIPKPHTEAFIRGRRDKNARFAEKMRPYSHVGFRDKFTTPGRLPAELGGGRIKPVNGQQGRFFHGNENPGGRAVPLSEARLAAMGKGRDPFFGRGKKGIG